MTQDEIIEIAQQCNLIGIRPYLDGIYSGALESFAKLVAAKAIAELESQGKTMKVEGPLHVVCQCDKCKTESQEPVAWWNDTATHIDLNVSGRGTPLYTYPPQRTESVIDKSAAIRIATSLGWSSQRTWIGLTDNEFNELYDRYVPLTCYALLIEKVEAKLKEKNGFAEDSSVTEQNICLKCRSFFCDHTCKTNPEENT
jgi:hypothetical protein